MSHVSDFTQSEDKIILDLINFDNASNLSLTQVNLGAITSLGERSTQLTVTPIANSGYAGSQTVTYNRLDINEFLNAVTGSYDITLQQGDAENVSDFLDEINTALGTNIQLTDIVDAAIPELTGVPNEELTADLVIAATSKVYLGQFTITIDGNDIPLSSVITTRILGGLNLPVIENGGGGEAMGWRSYPQPEMYVLEDEVLGDLLTYNNVQMTMIDGRLSYQGVPDITDEEGEGTLLKFDQLNIVPVAGEEGYVELYFDIDGTYGILSDHEYVYVRVKVNEDENAYSDLCRVAANGVLISRGYPGNVFANGVFQVTVSAVGTLPSTTDPELLNPVKGELLFNHTGIAMEASDTNPAEATYNGQVEISSVQQPIVSLGFGRVNTYVEVDGDVLGINYRTDQADSLNSIMNNRHVWIEVIDEADQSVLTSGYALEVNRTSDFQVYYEVYVALPQGVSLVDKTVTINFHRATEA